MPNPFLQLIPALKVLAENTHILPATGQAQEYLQQFDIDEIYDRIRTKDDKKVDVIIEAPNRNLYVHVPPLPRTKRHLFRYFLDGSVKSYFLGTAVQHDRHTPVLLAQIAAAAVKREDNGRVHVARNKKRLLLLVNKSQLSEDVWNQLQTAMNNISFMEGKLVNTQEEDPNNAGLNNKEERSRAAHRANWEMRVLEMELAKELPRQENGWLVLDGGLGKEFREWKGRTDFIGVAKSFSKEPIFYIGRGPRGKIMNLFQLLSRLEVQHRTCVFAIESGKVAFWYVRIQEQRHLEYPLMGVVKVELPNPKGEAVPSELVDLISRALVAERNVTPYGRDRRWHAHLYPIYLAEQVLKNGFYSDEVLRAAIKWPGLERSVQ